MHHVLAGAVEQARRLGAGPLNSAHLLLGLFGDEAVARQLASLTVTAEEIEREYREIASVDAETSSFDADMERLLAMLHKPSQPARRPSKPEVAWSAAAVVGSLGREREAFSARIGEFERRAAAAIAVFLDGGSTTELGVLDELRALLESARAYERTHAHWMSTILAQTCAGAAGPLAVDGARLREGIEGAIVAALAPWELRIAVPEEDRPAVADVVGSRLADLRDNVVVQSGGALAVRLAPREVTREPGFGEWIAQQSAPVLAALVAAGTPAEAAEILACLPVSIATEVLRHVLEWGMEQPLPPEAKRLAAEVARAYLRPRVPSEWSVDAVAEILNLCPRSLERAFLKPLDERDPEMAETIRRRMFTFEDVIRVNDKGIQNLLKNIDTSQLALALRTAPVELQEKFFQNMSARAAEIVKEEMVFMGPVRLSDVEAAQMAIVDVARRLEAQGELLIEGREGGDEIVV